MESADCAKNETDATSARRKQHFLSAMRNPQSDALRHQAAPPFRATIHARATRELRGSRAPGGHARA